MHDSAVLLDGGLHQAALLEEEALVISLDHFHRAETGRLDFGDSPELAQMLEQETECRALTTSTDQSFPSTRKKNGDEVLVEVLKGNAFSFQPTAQPQHELNFVVRRRFAIALLEEVSGEVFQMRLQRSLREAAERGGGLELRLNVGHRCIGTVSWLQTTARRRTI